MDEADSRPQYPIRTAARRSGLSPHVLRAWERRYGVVEPTRHPGGSRLYTDAEIERFRMLRTLTEAGHSIGRIARLPGPELLELYEREAATKERPAERSRDLHAAAAGYIEEALIAIEAMDGSQVHAILMRAVVALSSQDFIDGVLIPLLRRVGELWEEDQLCPAHEHVFSAQVSRVLGWLLDTIPVAEGASHAVAVSPAGQRHEFGAMLAAIVAAEEGWRITYLGADLPTEDVAAAIRVRRAKLLLLSAIAGDPIPQLDSELRELRRAVGGELKIFMGGQESASRRRQVERAGGEWLPDLEALRVELRRLKQEEVGG